MTAPCRQMNTCSQLTVRQEEDKEKTSHSDMHLGPKMLYQQCGVVMSIETFNWWIHCKQQHNTKSFVLWHSLIFSQHLVLPALPWSQTHFILWDNGGLVPSSVVWQYQLHSGLWHIWGIASVPPVCVVFFHEHTVQLSAWLLFGSMNYNLKLSCTV